MATDTQVLDKGAKTFSPSNGVCRKKKGKKSRAQVEECFKKHASKQAVKILNL